jgi:hypothetical protein
MIRQSRIRRQSRAGFVLPLAVMLVAVLGVIGFGVVFLASQSKSKELAGSKIDNKYHGIAYSGVSIAENGLRPPDLNTAHKWTQNYTNTFHVDIDGVKVYVKVEDITK